MDFTDISYLLVIASVFGIFAKYLKQPVLVGYLFAGILISRFGIINKEYFDALSKIGIALLLFLVGMEINITDVSTVGKTALITGIGQIVFTSIVGFLISSLLGFDPVSSIYIAVALTFSSTIIIVKLLSEKRDLNSLYGKISLGFLLIQDLVAVIILMVLSAVNSNSFTVFSFLIFLFKVCFLFGLTWYLSKKILPRIFEKIVGHSSELLFIVSIAWALGISSLVGGPLGFSFEIGGFLAGIALSNIPEHLGIASKTKPLRDFFLTIFFILLGSQMVAGNFGEIIVPSVIFSLFVLLGNPLIVLIILGILGYKKRTSFMASVTVAQISEFSFILMAMGNSLGHFGKDVVGIIVLVGAITMTASTYIISGSDKIYSKIKKFLVIFEKRNVKEKVFQDLGNAEFSGHIILIGCDRTGKRILPFFKNNNYDLIVVDHNPEVYKNLSSKGIRTILGDITDSDVVDLCFIESAKAVVCTISSPAENLYILNRISKLRDKPLFIGSSQTREDAVKLYEKKADYVVVPEVLAGEFLRHIFISRGVSTARLRNMGKNHFKRLTYEK